MSVFHSRLLRKVIAVSLAVMMVSSAAVSLPFAETSFAPVVSAASNSQYTTSDGITYSYSSDYYSGKTASVIAYNPPEGAGDELVIPDTISVPGWADDYKVTSISGDGMTSVFSGKNIRKVTLSSNISSIGNYVFQDCDTLEEIVFNGESSLYSIGYRAFKGCTALKSVDIPAKCSDIGDGAFADCTLLESVVYEGIPSGIKANAFDGTKYLESITYGDNLIYDNTVFFGYNGDAPENTEITIPDGILVIAGSAKGSSNITKINIPDSVTYIGSQAFKAFSLTELVLPENLYPYFTKQLWDIPTLKVLDLHKVTVTNSDGRIYDYYSDTDKDTEKNKTIERIVFPKGVKLINTNLAQSCPNLKEVSFAEGLEEISGSSSGPFKNSNSIRSIKLPSTIKSLGSSAFPTLSSISNGGIIIPVETAKTISVNSFAFGGTNNIPVYIEKSDDTANNTISSTAFSDYSYGSLILIEDGITVPDDNTLKNYAFFEKDDENKTITIKNICDGFNAGYLKNGSAIDYDGKEYTLVLPSELLFSYELIDNDTHASITGFNDVSTEEITVPATLGGVPVTSIGESAFAYGSNPALKKVTLPDTVTDISEYAFSYSDISEINLPDSIKTIGSGAFEDTKIEKVKIPAGAEYIGESVFSGCDKLVMADLSECSQNVSYRMFSGCTELSTVVLNHNIKEIGSYAFERTGLENIILPSKLEVIGEGAFDFCDKLKSLQIPDTVKKADRIISYSEDSEFSNGVVYNSMFLESENGWSGIFSNVSKPVIVLPSGYGKLSGKFIGQYDGTLYIDYKVNDFSDDFYDNYSSYCCVTIDSNAKTVTVDPATIVRTEHDLKVRNENDDDKVYINEEEYKLIHGYVYVPQKSSNCNVNGYSDHFEDENGYCYTKNSDGSYTPMTQEEVDALLLPPDESAHEYDEGGLCKYCGAIQDGIGARLIGHSLTLDGSIGVNFYININIDTLRADRDNINMGNDAAVIRFTLPNGETEDVRLYDGFDHGTYNPSMGYITEDPLDSEYYNLDYVNCCYQCHVTPREINDTIKAQIILADGTKGTEYSYSVKEYADYIINHANDMFEYYDDQEKQNLVDLAKSMLYYGYNAQEYFGNHSGNTAADEVLINQYNALADEITADTLSENAAYVNFVYNTMEQSKSDPTESENVTFAGANLSLKSTTTLRLYFKVKDMPIYTGSETISDEYVSFLFCGDVVTPKKYKDYYYIEIPDLTASNATDVITLIVKEVHKDGNSSRYASTEVSYSPLSYVQNVISKTDEVRTAELQQLMKAYYLYVKSTRTYFGY